MKNITADQIAQLKAELIQDLEFVELNYQKNREMTRRLESMADPTEFDYAALGYTMHNLYNALESYFLRIAKFFENNLDQAAWHRSLIERMTLEIPGVRNALLTQADRIQIEELMRFRHLFRNLYKTPLVPEKLLYANRQAEGIDRLMETRHTQFDDFLSALTAEMET
ncbi:MAG: hypothetical protein WD492_16460 [Alkalispirochaeta sp.]